jgi:hypothetical protein
MRKIPTVFVRDPDDRKHVLPAVTPGCEWVLAGEGVPTRKYDGTCTMFDGSRWWARREVKPGKEPPPGFVEVERDETTGKTVGWEPAEQSSFAKLIAEVATNHHEARTYELVGPKVNGNPEAVAEHMLVPHGYSAMEPEPPRDYVGLRAYFADGERCPARLEGIVWHHPDGRMAKVKVRDFPASVSQAVS